MEKTEQAMKDEFNAMVGKFISLKPPHQSSPELEIRFGTHPKTRLTKIDYDNVVQQLYQSGYVCPDKQGTHLLRISPEYEFVNKQDQLKKSKLRLEIAGIETIEEYCNANDDLPAIFHVSKPISFTIKSQVHPDILFHNFGFRVSFQNEFHSSPNDPKNTDIFQQWNQHKKTYRYLNRVRFHHPTVPFFLDLSIVRSSRMKDRRPLAKYTLRDAGVFHNQETYEVELELDYQRIKREQYTLETLMTLLRQHIRLVMSGIQRTQYPIGVREKDDVLYDYMGMIHGHDKVTRSTVIRTRDFIGPSSYTLQLNHVIAKDDSHNVLTHYCVTDKADGTRMLLYVTKHNKIYLIDNNMNVMFTGIVLGTKDTKVKFQESLLDGEFIKYDKQGKIINLFVAFDIYYHHNKCVSAYFFDKLVPDEKEPVRLQLLNEFVTALNETMTSVTNHGCSYRIQCKRFERHSSIFQACKETLARVYDYHTDGLIFTPINASVGGEPGNKTEVRLLNKMTWEYSFKWKPPEFNTVDFLVNIKKDDKGQDLISTCDTPTSGLDMEDSSYGIQQYKTLILHCGYSKAQHGFVTSPFLHMVNQTFPSKQDPESDLAYKPVPFAPTQPADSTARYCNVLWRNDTLMTEEDEYFEGNTIIEFKYDTTRPGNWKWIPLRVRHDKTQELLSGSRHKNYGNDFRVANSNWTSIHYPITQEMLTTGKNIPTTSVLDDVYYNKGDKKSQTKPLRDFHNLFVKRRLILGTSKVVNVADGKKLLIDYAVGKGGDLSKWMDARLFFVFGIDIKGDNIENNLNGACARYLNEKMTFHDPKKFHPNALFIKGNSGQNLRDGSAFQEDENVRYKDIAQAVFGRGSREELKLGRGVYPYYGIGEQGFHISSCQFAIHYFFQDATLVHEFLRNVSENTMMNGYFIGTCYDGMEIFRKLETKKHGETFSLYSRINGTKIVEIGKQYHQTAFDGDSTNCLGYKIHVFQETINQTFAEYLVHFDYFHTLMLQYGFQLVTKEQSNAMGLPNATGLFSELFTAMERERNHSNFGQAIYMTPEEKTLSFLNRYFVFQKVRHAATGMVTTKSETNNIRKTVLKKTEKMVTVKEVAVEVAAETVKTTIIKRPKPKPKV